MVSPGQKFDYAQYKKYSLCLHWINKWAKSLLKDYCVSCAYEAFDISYAITKWWLLPTACYSKMNASVGCRCELEVWRYTLCLFCRQTVRAGRHPKDRSSPMPCFLILLIPNSSLTPAHSLGEPKLRTRATDSHTSELPWLECKSHSADLLLSLPSQVSRCSLWNEPVHSG